MKRFILLILTLLSSFIISSMITRFLIVIQRKHNKGQEINEYLSYSHKKKKNTPTCGGVSIIISVIFTSFMNLELYNHKELMKESFKVVLPNDHELLKNDSVSLNDLKNYQIALPRSYVDSILEQARMKNISLSIDTITSSTSGAIEIAKEKNILAIVPLPDNESPINKNCIKKLILPKYNEFSRNILWKKGSILSSVSQKFLDECDVK